MLYLKSAIPQAEQGVVYYSAFEKASEFPVTLINAPPGYFWAGGLVAVAAEKKRPLAWLRLEPDDSDPSAFMLSLVQATQRLNPVTGQATLQYLRAQSGILPDWAGVFQRFKYDLAETLPEGALLVIEKAHWLLAGRSWELLNTCILSGLPSKFSFILITHRPADMRLITQADIRTMVPANGLPQVFQPIRLGQKDLRLEMRSALALAERMGVMLTDKIILKANRLLGGRAVILAGLFNASRVLGPVQTGKLVGSASRSEELLTNTARSILAGASRGALRSLALSIWLEYAHPDLLKAAVNEHDLPSGPWVQYLSDGWKRPYELWRPILASILQPDDLLTKEMLRRAIQFLESQGETRRALRLYLHIGDHAEAARLFTNLAQEMLSLGQWDTAEQTMQTILRYRESDLTTQILPVENKPAWFGLTRPPLSSPDFGNAWARLKEIIINWLHTGQPDGHPPVTVEGFPNTAGQAHDDIEVSDPKEAINHPADQSPAGDELFAVKAQPADELQAEVERLPEPETSALNGGESDQLKDILIYCLGSFRVSIHQKPVDSWNSRKAQLIFKYLAASHPNPVSKDVLMSAFWPEADPESARRNLHQAVYALRQTLKAIDPARSYIYFENDCYQISSGVEVWIDAIEFMRHAQAGLALERISQFVAAMEEFHQAERLYQGDFMADDLYDDWPEVQRQHLKENYFHLAQRLAQHYLDGGNYRAAVEQSQRILSLDNTVEEAHQTLIRAYLAQGNRRLALIQYQTCLQILETELEIHPMPETKLLYQQIIG